MIAGPSARLRQKFNFMLLWAQTNKQNKTKQNKLGPFISHNGDTPHCGFK
jgi:hypothetical protein